MKKGFTLIEIMVAVSIFSIVAVIVGGALISASQINRKAQAIRLAMDNLSFAIESMVTTFREGSKFYCIEGTPNLDGIGNYNFSKKCGSEVNGQAVAVTSQRADTSGDIILYGVNGGVLQLARSSGGGWIDMISPELIEITSAKFRVYEASGVVGTGERVVISLAGQTTDLTRTPFMVETTVTPIDKSEIQ